MAVAGPNAAVLQRGARIAVLRDGRELWRSRGRFRAVGVFATVGPGAIAFSYDRYERRRSRTSLYLAPLGGHERQLASEERPLGWTRRGELLTWRFRQGFIGVYRRAVDGRLLGRAAARLRDIRFQPVSRTLLALSRSGLLERFDGVRWRRLADLGSLGFGRGVSFEPLAGGLIGVLDWNRVAVLREDGSLFASARFPARRGLDLVAGQSGLVANASGSAVAFAVTSRDRAYGGSGRESLYVLRSGDRQARALYGGRLRFAGKRWATLDWHHAWLLYATTEGKTIALDSRRPGRRVDLGRLVRRLTPPTRGGVESSWARP